MAVRKVGDTSGTLCLADKYDGTLSAGVTFATEGDYEVAASAAADPMKKLQGSPLKIAVWAKPALSDAICYGPGLRASNNVYTWFRIQLIDQRGNAFPIKQVRKEQVKVQALFGGLEPIKQHEGSYSISFTSGTPSDRGTITRVSINDTEISETPIISGVSSSQVTSPSKSVVSPTFHEVLMGTQVMMVFCPSRRFYTQSCFLIVCLPCPPRSPPILPKSGVSKVSQSQGAST